jgi:alkaline phosphatase D
MLGSEQEAWLNAGFMAARGNWNVIAQQTLMAQIDRKPGPGSRAWTDGWDGYPVARRRLLEGIAARRPANPVVIGGDVHSYWAAELKTDFDDLNSPVVASEFCGSSITSDGPAQTAIDALLPENPHVKYARGDWRGYVRVEMRPAQLRADFRAMETVKVADAACNTIASFAVESGRLGPQKI